ncbi:uncharacterized protein ACLA_062520 [Aspergillus clavatus NRRL 1]|uniref:Uncharacterized protein n=1 Tax=Aspergillus clavatus (strain ATCC 1007 / CBS 513.65 / DSM 816 / NCTC 3887 / NRRL 1 / QM 1276 / 107) TaxID=344612 RepID=A1CCN0_ASPCL|nr:uncharacterized protein ACLA_062520 [Aspergillus clavatus NRRL 1]EAW12287.1 conserved hypothetical protein [Aspergillus clavatus NRRL 1]
MPFKISNPFKSSKCQTQPPEKTSKSMKGDSASVLSDAATLVPDKNQPSDVSRESDRGLDFNSVRYAPMGMLTRT